MKITTIGIDLAKEVFQFHGVNEQGKTVNNVNALRSTTTDCTGNQDMMARRVRP